ncbi:MAG: hypothetical protein K1X89_23945, partial [Myxococcaceae bacterium]|nr:hypothetical protein [Myxococcaceae bacterium]
MWPGSENTPTPLPEPGELTDRHQTVRFDAFPEGGGVVAMHLAIAERLLAEGAKGRAFTELVRASREVPMSGPLASALVTVALRAGTGNTAAVLLQQGVEETDGQLRIAVQRSLARLYRRLGDLEKAREQLVLVLAEQPEDRRARAVLNALLEREARWDELDASLEKDTREALRRKDLQRASRAALKRARLWGEKLDNPARAALRHGQAAQYAEQGGDDRNAFILRVLWLRMLHRSGAPERALGDAFEATLRAGERVGEADRVRAVAKELKLRGITLTDVELPLDGGAGREPTAHAGAKLGKAHSTQLELLAVAEELAARTTSGPEVAAVLQAAADESGDQQALLKLEAHLIARRAWRELADHYRSAAGRVSPAADKVAWLEKLAELLESELDDAVGAARAWAEVAELSGDPHAVQEQVRLHSSQRDEAGVQRALNEGVIRASSSLDRAQALVARAEEALARAALTAAFADLTAALKVSPGHLGALASLAELGAVNGESEPARRFQHALQALPRRTPGRGELQRRLARLSDQGTLPPEVARAAWAEVVVELPDDEEATSRLASLARAAGDTSRLEAALRAQIAKEPRGPRTRKARLDLVRVLDERGSDAQAMEELKQAVRHEPGHQEAWVLYAERLKARRSYGEAAWAMEHAATATEDGERRCELWRALATFCREALRDAAKADVLERRAETLRRELDEEKAVRRGAPADLLTAPPSGR